MVGAFAPPTSFNNMMPPQSLVCPMYGCHATVDDVDTLQSHICELLPEPPPDYELIDEAPWASSISVSSTCHGEGGEACISIGLGSARGEGK
jgi:hypothetical protein